MSSPIGHHIVLDMHACACDPELLGFLGKAGDLIREVENLTHPLGRCLHQSKPSGWSAVILLEESHISLHTWPQHKFVSADLFTCNGRMPQHIVDILVDAFKPDRFQQIDLHRGGLNLDVENRTDFQASPAQLSREPQEAADPR